MSETRCPNCRKVIKKTEQKELYCEKCRIYFDPFKCVFCDNDSIMLTDNSRMVMCESCGSYVFSEDLSLSLANPKFNIKDTKHLIAGYLFETKLRRESVNITSNKTEEILKSSRIPKTKIQQCNKLLSYLYTNNEFWQKRQSVGDADGVYIDIFDCEKLPPASAYAKKFSEIQNLCQLMNDMGWLIGYQTLNSSIICFNLSAKGHMHAEELLQTSLDSSKVFVAMQFRDVDGYDNYTVVRDKINEAVQSATSGKWTAHTIDEKPHNNHITFEIMAEIKTSQFVIVDLTHSNLGAYWEAGYAKGRGKEVIFICDEDWKRDFTKINGYDPVHFDINQIHTIYYSASNYDKLVKNLQDKIRATIL